VIERTLDTRPVPPRKLAHVVLRSAHYEESISWYRSVLSARAVFESPFITFLTYDEEHHRVAIIDATAAPAAPATAAGVDHLAFTFASIGDLLSTYRRLRDEGVGPHWCVNHGPTTSLYYRDPDGVQIELQVDNFDTPEDFREWADSGVFTTNPIGVDVDPEDLCRRYLAGESERSLRRQEVES
jgi:catechol 2,3-dioxygenase-like lactoylglutathione lyase family enzyme